MTEKTRRWGPASVNTKRATVQLDTYDGWMAVTTAFAFIEKKFVVTPTASDGMLSDMLAPNAVSLRGCKLLLAT